MPVASTVSNPVTGVATTPFIGGDPIEELKPSSPADRGDEIVAAKPADATPATIPAAPAGVAEPPASTETPEPAASTEEPAPAAAPAEVVPPEDDRPRDKNGKFIPKARFDEVNDRMKAAEKELADRKAAEAAAVAATQNQFDFDAKEKDYADAVLAGEIDRAIALRKEIRAAEQVQYEQVATQKATTVTRQQTTQEKVNEVSERYAADYDVFNPDGANYNDEVVSTVEVLMAGFNATQKYTDAGEALEAAIQQSLRLHGIPLKAAPTTPPPVTPAAPTTPPVPVRTAQKRVEAIVAQPPIIARTGNQSADHGDTTINVANLSEAEFAKLPEATKRRLRGDLV